MAIKINPLLGQKAAAAYAPPTALVPQPAAPAPKPDVAPLLAAGAQGGQAGLDAFKQAQAQIGQLQADALANARARAALIGGPEAQGFEKIAGDQYGRINANLLQSGAVNQGYQDANRAAFDKYYGQLKSDMGPINQWIQRQLSEYGSAKAAKAAAKANKLTKANLLGVGQTLADEYGQMLNDPDAFTADESARALAAYKGISPVKVNTLLGPRPASKPAAKVVPEGPDTNWLMGPFRYDGKQINLQRANEVLSAPEVPLTNQFVGTLANVRVVNGRIDDDSVPAEFRGLTPEQAFNKWLDAREGIRTMKTAMRDYYLPWIRENVK